MTAQNRVNTALTRPGRVFSRPFTHGGICPPYEGGTSAGDKPLIRGTHEEGGLMYRDSTVCNFALLRERVREKGKADFH